MRLGEMNMQQREREDIHAHAGTNTPKNYINKELLLNNDPKVL